MQLNLDGKKAVVTGSTRGIGFAIVAALAREGADVVFNGRTQEAVDTAAQALGDVAGTKCQGVVADLSTRAGIAKIIAAAPTADILVNNLGIYELANFFETTDEQWQHIFDVNVFSGVRLSRHYVPGMLERNWGRVIFISSESGFNPDPTMVHYSTTKTANFGIARGLAELTKGTRVTVNSVAPGPTRTDVLKEFLATAYADKQGEEAERACIQDIRPNSLIQRLTQPEEVGDLVAFVASERSAAINGETIRIEGGTVRSIT